MDIEDPEHSRQRFIPFTPSAPAMEVDPDDDRQAQRAAARRSVRYRRCRNGAFLFGALAVVAGAAVVWELAFGLFGAPGWVPPAVLTGCVTLAAVLGHLARRMIAVLRASDGRIGVPVPAAHLPKLVDGILVLREKLHELPRVPEPVRRRLYARTGALQYDFFRRVVVGGHRVREAWATGDGHRWQEASNHLVALCADIERFGTRVDAILRELRGY